eukprot:gene26893-35276_t
MNLLHKKHVRLLSHYLPEQPVTPDMLKQWQGQNGRQIFVVDQGQRRGIPNFDTFLALNFTMADVTVISDVKLSSIPVILYTTRYLLSDLGLTHTLKS